MQPRRALKERPIAPLLAHVGASCSVPYTCMHSRPARHYCPRQKTFTLGRVLLLLFVMGFASGDLKKIVQFIWMLNRSCRPSEGELLLSSFGDSRTRRTCRSRTRGILARSCNLSPRLRRPETATGAQTTSLFLAEKNKQELVLRRLLVSCLFRPSWRPATVLLQP